MKKRFTILHLLLALLIALSGCGGGGGGGGSDAGLSGEPPYEAGSGDETGGILLPDTPSEGDGGDWVGDDGGAIGGGSDDGGLSGDPSYEGGSGEETGGIIEPPSSGDGSGSVGGGSDSAGGGNATAGAKGVIGAESAVGAGAWNREVPVRSQTVMVSAPGTLSQPDTEYILTQDIVASGTAFTIAATNVTLNLNGRTVTYAESASSGPCYGVNITQYGLRNVAIVNGTIRQGTGASATDNSKAGWHVVNFGPDVPGMKIAGVKFEYRTPETSAISAVWGKDGEIHNNDFNDTGSTIINRHQLLSVIKVNRGAGMKIHHNNVIRARQAGIDLGPGGVAHNNVINIDSRCTNSYGVSAFEIDGFTIYNNTIIGKGEHPIGIGMVAGARNGKVYGNRIEVQNTLAGAEYGSSGAAGMRMTWGTDNVELWNNHITVKAQANLLGAGLDSWGRGLWLGLPDPASKVLFRDNTIVAKNNDGRAKAAGIAVVCLNESPGLVFRNNLVVSNWGNVLLTDDYGHSGGYPRFVGNTFRKEDDHANYSTIRSDYPSRVSTGNFFANRFENGAAAGSLGMEFNGSGLKEIGFGWTLRLTVRDAQNRTVSGATVRIADNAGETVFSGATGSDGVASTELVEYLATNRSSYAVSGALTKDAFGLYGNRIRKNPYTITVESGGRQTTRTIEIIGNLALDVVL